jgi:DNA-directed RNA polymerase subunit RPC12/RpoP
MKNFTKRDEGFICKNCNKKVEKLGYTSRDHCPHCLCSLHVDILPGDRNETCHGLLRPISVELDSKKGYVIIYKCDRCGSIRKNKAAKDDDMDLIIKLTANGGNIYG